MAPLTIIQNLAYKPVRTTLGRVSNVHPNLAHIGAQLPDSGLPGTGLSQEYFRAYWPVRFGQNQSGQNQALIQALRELLGEGTQIKDGKPQPSIRAMRNNFQQYRESNTTAPLAVYHTLIEDNAEERALQNQKTLEAYINQQGEQFLDIPFIRHRKSIYDEGCVVVDTETTDKYMSEDDRRKLRPQDRANQDEEHVRIVQLAWTPMKPGGEIDYASEGNRLYNPGKLKDGSAVQIQPGAAKVHHISNEMVAGIPTSLDDEITEIRRGKAAAIPERTPLVVYNSRFDVPLLNAAIRRGDTGETRGALREIEPALVIDPMILIQRIHPFVSTRKKLDNTWALLMGQELTEAHDAQADVHATVDVLKYIMHYLEKHTVPLEWGMFAKMQLERQWGQAKWDALDSNVKMGLILDYIKDPNNQNNLRRLAVKPIPLRYIDILRFQWAGKTAYDQSELDQYVLTHGQGGHSYHAPAVDYLPRFDIALKHQGYDSAKLWNGSDVLDRGVVQEIRQQRDAENRKFLSQSFVQILPTNSRLATAMAQLKTGNPKNTDVGAKLERAFYTEIGQSLVLPAFLKANLSGESSDPAALASLEPAVVQALSQYIKTKVNGASIPATQLNLLVKDVMGQIAAFQTQYGKHTWYTLSSVPESEWLIDPAILMNAIAAMRKDPQIRAKYEQNPIPLFKTLFGDDWTIFASPKFKENQWAMIMMIEFLFALKEFNGPVDQFARDVLAWAKRYQQNPRGNNFKDFLEAWTHRLARQLA